MSREVISLFVALVSLVFFTTHQANAECRDCKDYVQVHVDRDGQEYKTGLLNYHLCVIINEKRAQEMIASMAWVKEHPMQAALMKIAGPILIITFILCLWAIQGIKYFKRD